MRVRGFSSGALAGTGQLVVRVVHRVETLPELVDRLVVLLELRAEGADEPKHLVTRPLEHDGLERLADHAQHREQGERRAEDDLLLEGVVDHRRVGLVDEPGDRLVRDEQEQLLARQARAVEVVAPGEVAHFHPHVADELLA